jgi:uncharacterized protein (DUF1015 family)
VICQPYDRVRYGLQDRYYDLSPYNAVRITKGKALSGDLPEHPVGPNAYTRARETYDRWLAEGVLVQETAPALYVYHQTFTLDGVSRTRQAFVAALELTKFPQGIVLPHERTDAGPKLDRLRLLRALEVNVGLIFLLYPDPGNRISEMLDTATAGRAPDVSAAELLESDVRQELWVVTDPEAIRAVQAEMAPKRNLIIADGHHRYETALNYRDEMRARHREAAPDAAFNYRMVGMVSMDDPGLVILPTHREIYDRPGFSRSDVLAQAEDAFDIHSATGLAECLAQMRALRSKHAFGLYADGAYSVLVLKDPAYIAQRMSDSHSHTWKSLDVSVLHRMLLEDIVGLSGVATEDETHLRYHRDPTLAIQNVDAGVGDFVFLLNPTRVAQVKACAAEGVKMPQKSTDFYPKMVTGLTMMPVRTQEGI